MGIALLWDLSQKGHLPAKKTKNEKLVGYKAGSGKWEETVSALVAAFSQSTIIESLIIFFIKLDSSSNQILHCFKFDGKLSVKKINLWKIEQFAVNAFKFLVINVFANEIV